jgi:hypothetical protein
MVRRRGTIAWVSLLMCVAVSGSSFADVFDPLVLNSRPSAPYTIYLDFGGFTFNGNWGNDTSQTPGVTPAYTVDGNASSFSSTELADMKNIWSRVSEKYSWANINVTTVDPAVAAGQSGSDLLRQNYYDNTAKVMHTVIGGNGSWSTGGGISYLGVTGKTQSGTNGYHTDWVFAADNPSNLQFVGEAAAHENGHGFGLSHQSDYSGNTLVEEYSAGDALRAPIMGDSYSTQRGLWKIGTAHVSSGGPTTQNDVHTILSTSTNPGIAIVNDGIGHTRAAATALPLSGSAIDFNAAAGVIAPANTNPNTNGLINYTTDYWKFTTNAGTASITVNAGRESITPGVSDPGAMLDASLNILDSAGSMVASATTSSLSETITTNLAAGTYYAQVLSAADPNITKFFDLGSYFLTGSIVTTPPVIAGDFNQDGHQTAADILPMEAALTNLSGAQTTYGANYMTIADVNDDGEVTNADLQALLNQLNSGGGSTSVPEPNTLALLSLGALVMTVVKLRRSP